VSVEQQIVGTYDKAWFCYLFRKLYVQSEPYEEELTSMGVFRNKSKVIVGSSKGNFYTFNWGQFGYHCDAFSGPVAPVSKMIPITDRIAITGGEEGILRAMHLVPGRILGTVGQHSLAVEAMDISNNGELVASSSHDNDIRFWNIKYFETFDDIKYNEKSNKKKAMRHNLPSSKEANRGDFFADLAE
jgi:WD repeat-containing protein 55